MSASTEGVRADVLAHLLLIQSTASQLPSATTLFAFVCRGLEQLPGVLDAVHVDDAGEGPAQAPETQRFPVQLGAHRHGELVVRLGEAEHFRPYAPYLTNLAFVLAVVLEERRQRELTEVHQRELEQRVQERTRQLSEEVRDRQAAVGEALAEKQRAEDYLDIAEAIIVELDAEGRVTVLNKRGCDLLGVTLEAALGRDWLELAVPPEEHAAERSLTEALRQGRAEAASHHDGSLVSSTGARRVVAWHSRARREGSRAPGTLSSGLDITERKLAEWTLAAEKERLAVTLRSIGDGVITTDTSGNVVELNQVAEALTGWTLPQALGRPLGEVFPVIGGANGAPAPGPVEQALAGQPADELRGEVLRSRQGRERAIARSVSPMRDRAGATVGVVVVFRDITERLKLVEHLQRAQRLDAIGVLAGGIAHDFNNLLGGLFGFLDVARAQVGPGAGALPESLDQALEMLARARDLTRQLLTFSKGGAPVCAVVELGPLVRRAVRFALSGLSATCEVTLGPALPAVEVDANQIGQVIDNLVRNAIQAMPTGGALWLEADAVEVGGEEHPGLLPGRYARLSVKDRGSGIAPEILPKIFDPFFTTREQGSGLGLATAYSIIQKHRGTIEVESTLGVGTTFHVYLPAATGTAAAASTPTPVPHKGSGHALVLDDEAYLRNVFTRMFVRLGYAVTAVGTGEAAIDAARAAQAAGAPFTVALLDLTVPGAMGGREAVGELRRVTPGLLAIASSGYSEDSAISRPAEFGFTASLGKPFTGSELAEVLARHGARAG